MGYNLLGSYEFLSAFGGKTTLGECWLSVRGKRVLSDRRIFEIIATYFNQDHKQNLANVKRVYYYKHKRANGKCVYGHED